MSKSKEDHVPDHAQNAYRLGWISVGSLVISLVLGLMIRTIGINNLLLPIVIPLSLLAVLAARSSMKKFDDKESAGYQKAKAGYRLGLGVLVGAVAFVFLAAIFFTMLFPRN